MSSLVKNENMISSRATCQKKFLLLLLLATISFTEKTFASQQNIFGTIRGKVVDKKTNELIAFATILIKEIHVGCVTDENGVYMMKGVPKGVYKVQCTLIGYKTVVKEVFVKPSEIIYLDFVLDEEQFHLDEPMPFTIPKRKVYECIEERAVKLSMYIESGNTWVLDWDDISKTGCEYYCLVTDSSGIIGEYHGLSTSMNFCYFKTSSKQITVHFKTGAIMSGDLPPDSSCRCTFKEIVIPVIDHSEVKLQLTPDRETKYYRFKVNDTYYRPFSKRLYYLNSKTGDVKTGKYWLTHLTDAEFYQSTLIVINPYKKYNDRKGNIYKGSKLIKERKIKYSDLDAESLDDGFDFWNY